MVGLRHLLAKFWKEPKRHYYLGEWHYHPAKTVEPSCEDFTQMRLISESSDYNCAEPVLLIVGEGMGIDLPAKVLVFPKGTPVLNLKPEIA